MCYLLANSRLPVVEAIESASETVVLLTMALKLEVMLGQPVVYASTCPWIPSSTRTLPCFRELRGMFIHQPLSSS